MASTGANPLPRGINARARGANPARVLGDGARRPPRDREGKTDAQIIIEEYIDDCRWHARHFFLLDRMSLPHDVTEYTHQFHDTHPEITDKVLQKAKSPVSRLLSRMKSSWLGRIRQQVSLWLFTDYGEVWALGNHGATPAHRGLHGPFLRSFDEHLLRVAPYL
jgi:hypothetical protein